MHIVAIYNLNRDKDGLAKVLAAAIGVTLYEAQLRLLAPGSGPLAIAVCAEQELAVQLAGKLQTEGFNALALPEDEIEHEDHAQAVKRFSLGEHELGIVTEQGNTLSILFENIELILRGTAIFRDVTTETVKIRSLSPGRAVLTGGLTLTKTTKKVREVTAEERQGFLNLYAKDNTILIFRENILVYNSFGSAIQPSRVANFAYLITELRRRCPDAQYDERLLNRAGQVAILGPSLNPEEHLRVATALLRKVLFRETK